MGGFAQGIAHSCHQHPQGLSQLPQLQGQSWLPLWRLEVGPSCRGEKMGPLLSTTAPHTLICLALQLLETPFISYHPSHVQEAPRRWEGSWRSRA